MKCSHKILVPMKGNNIGVECQKCKIQWERDRIYKLGKNGGYKSITTFNLIGKIKEMKKEVKTDG